MPTEINGLPAHVLLIHLVVVLVPVAGLLLVAQAWWPAARRRIGVLGPLLCLLALVTIPLTTNSGEWLQRRLRPTPLIDTHVHLGDQLLPWVAGLFLLSTAVWLLDRRTAPAPTRVVLAGARGSVAVTLLVAVLATAVAVGTLVQIYRIGDSGAKAVWTGSVALPS
ncbi:MAG: hypothetical protein JWN35_1057 [Frankiales bacterium]|jgi:hypothetical protein|nr:hypothetical protein [Frankiales bacterium]